MRLKRIVAPLIVCLAALGSGLVPASASAVALPTLVGSVQDPVNLSGATSVAVSGHYAYTTAYYAGELTAVDISNPAHPLVAGHSPQVNSALCPAPPAPRGPSTCNILNADNVTIAGGYAFVTSANANASSSINDNGTGNAVTIFDIHTTPASPSVVGTTPVEANRLFGAYGIAVQGNHAYVAAQGCLVSQPCPDPTVGNQFSVIDISNPAAPSIVGNITNPANNALKHADSVALAGHYAFVTASYSNRLTVIDISNPTSPAIVASLSSSNFISANDVTIQGNYAYVADQNSSPTTQLTIVNISNPLSPTVVGSLSNAALNGAYRLRVSGNYAFVAGSSADTVSMIDVSNPASPKLIATVADSSHLHRNLSLDFAISGRHLIAASPYLSNQSRTVLPPYPLQPGGRTNTGTVSVIDIDPRPVSVTITSPLNGSNYRRGQVIAAAYTCTPGGVIPVGSCAGPVANGAPIDTSTLGQHTFTVTGQDQYGQTGSARVTYTVSTVGGVRPVLSGLHQSAKVWREHGRKHARRKPPLGTRFTFTLNEPATVTLSFTRTMSGRKAGGRCVAPTKKNRHHRACQRRVRAGTLTLIGFRGSNKFAFQGKINGHFLKPGTYIVAVTASANGLSSSRITLKFKIV